VFSHDKTQKLHVELLRSERTVNNSAEARAAFEAWYRERFPDADFSDALWRVEWEWYIWWVAWQAAKGESVNAQLEHRIDQLEAKLHVLVHLVGSWQAAKES
jgi:hypothetical protein